MSRGTGLLQRHGAPKGCNLATPVSRRVVGEEVEIASGAVSTQAGLNTIENKIMPKARILVVDDEQVQREMLRNILTLGGYDVMTAASGQEALEALARMGGSIILSDLKMPGMSGMELLTETRKRFPDTIFIMITAHPSTETKSEAINKGARAFLTKPIDADELFREITSVINN